MANLTPTTDEEARQQVERTDAFIAVFRELIASTVVDLASPCEAACRRGLERIAATADAVEYVTYANLANFNTALRGGPLDLIEVQLKCVGGGPTLGFQDATELPSKVPAGDRRGIKAALAIRRSMRTSIAGRNQIMTNDAYVTGVALPVRLIGLSSPWGPLRLMITERHAWPCPLRRCLGELNGGFEVP